MCPFFSLLVSVADLYVKTGRLLGPFLLRFYYRWTCALGRELPSLHRPWKLTIAECVSPLTFAPGSILFVCLDLFPFLSPIAAAEKRTLVHDGTLKLFCVAYIGNSSCRIFL